MAEHLLNLVLSDDAEMALSSLGDDDRRRVSGLLENLRRGRDDERVRFHSVAVATMPYHFAWQAGDWLIFFRQGESEVEVLSILRKDALRAFHAVGQARG
jgi:hypothetical protein